MTFATSTRDALYEQAVELLACVGEALADTDQGAPAEQCIVTGSEVAWDRCHCGQLTIHVPRVYPSDSFPVLRQKGPFNRGCTDLTVAEFVVTILRCQPAQDDDGMPPPCEAMSVATVIDFQDRWAVRRGVACCFAPASPTQPGRSHLVQEQLAVG